ncbi:MULTISPECIES: ATP-dependent nuclease [Shewanella]|uniref:ATP-dependent nuclease n=1 Tax=Shewanella TaxID=22 RepID=UPI000E1C2C04|nr:MULTISPECIES: AAA family ATPase [Shewanella]MCS6211655.1 AAA family ATPase [Shewanella baltica]
MYLSKLKIKGFRCFEAEFTVPFSSGLNVVVGENGAGKTAIISAIRQLFLDSESGRYSISNDDFFCAFTTESAQVSSFSITAEFDKLNPDEKVALLPWTGGSKTALLNLQAENKEIRGRYKKIMWGGPSRGSQFDPELVDLIQCIYLPPLRDAESKLTNGRQSRLSKLLKAINHKDLKKCRKDQQLHPLEERFRDFNETLATDETLSIKVANTLIAEHLEKAIGHHFGQSTRIQFAESDFTKIVEGLTLLFFPDMSPEDKTLFRSLSQNSLGYNNLLYIASILAELTLDDTEGDDKPLFKILLIEEPEAHLHPQLQIRLLNHLRSVAEDEATDVQVIVTTHSTVLASSVEMDSIIHLSKSNPPIATPLRECDLPDNSKQFINRWLDVTKSNLLFASGVILVEGIAEQMLVPALAKEILKDQKEGKKNIEDQGISVVNLNGIYFKHFMRLYCNLKNIDGEKDQDGLNIPVRCSGITDLDPPKKITVKNADGEDEEVTYIPYDENLMEGTNHAIQLVETITDSENARLYVGKYKTLEYDLAMEGNNAAIMAKIVASLWPKPKKGKSTVAEELEQFSVIDWTKKTSEETANAANIILKRIDDDNVGKGIFAQILADQITKGNHPINVPEYIKQAILWACSLEQIKRTEE